MKPSHATIAVLGASAVLAIVLLIIRTFPIAVDGGHGGDQVADAASAASAMAPLPAYPPAFPSSMTSALPGPGEIELCGVGPVSTGPDGPLGAAEREALAVLVSEASRLKQSPHEGDRSLGLALDVHTTGREAQRRATQAQPDCLHDSACLERAAKARARAASPIVDAMAAMAVATGDTQVYANALHACAGIGIAAPANCSRVTSEGWAALDPANALAWIGAAAEARGRGDDAVADAALKRAAEARNVSARYVPVSRLIAELPRTTQPTRALLLAQIAVVHGASPPKGYADLLAHCRGPALDQAGRKALCSDIFRVLLERGETLLDFSVAISLAAQTGAPVEEVTRLRGELRRLQFATRIHGENMLSCAWLGHAEQWIPAVSTAGELKHARALLSEQPGGALRDAPRGDGRAAARPQPN